MTDKIYIQGTLKGVPVLKNNNFCQEINYKNNTIPLHKFCQLTGNLPKLRNKKLKISIDRKC